MADDDPGNPPAKEGEVTPPAAGPTGSRAARPKEAWEPQVREPRRPDFVSRLAKTTDLPTEIAKERQKSRLGKHRAGAIRWEEGPPEDGVETPDASRRGLSRFQLTTLAGLGVVVAVLGAMWFAKSLLTSGPPPLPPTARPASGGGAEANPVLTDLEYKQATEVMTQFLESLTPEDLRAVLREPDRVWPQVQAYHALTPWRPFTVRSLPSKAEVRQNRGLLAGAVEVDDYQRFIIAMERTPDGIKVDWETFTGQGDMSWDDLILKRPTRPVVMRALVQADDYFNRDFPDSGTHACFQLIAHRDTHRVYGYVERGSKVHAQLASRTRINPRNPLTLRLQYPPGSRSDEQVEIVDVVADGWLVCDTTRVKDTDPAEPPPAVPPASGAETTTSTEDAPAEAPAAE
jgi:hypothetical protein